MLTPLSVENSRRLVTFFDEAGYVEANLTTYFGTAELPSHHLRNHARLLDRTREATPLNALLRWFWLGIAQTEAEVSAMVPKELLALLLESGVLEKNGTQLTPAAMLVPAEGFLIASDHPSAIDRAESEMVLWPNPTSKFLGRFTVRRHSRATLDIGAGGGILSLVAAKHSDHVVATDLNARAVSFAAFNIKLNGVTNIELLTGDRFAPVGDRRFDLVLSNPPFFITPQTGYLFCDNPFELDQLCRSLVKEAPEHLNEGGYLQMLCEWAQISGQPWQERVAEWLDGTGCDAWVMKGITQDPREYAQHRISETTKDTRGDAEAYNGYMNYYRERGVEAIHNGLIVMRRRSGGANWVRIEEVPKTSTGDLGELVESTFAAHDLLRELVQDDKLLAVMPKLADRVRLEQIASHSEGRWQVESLTLRLIRGFPFHLGLQPAVANFLATCDGTRTLEEAIQMFAANANAPIEIVRRECLGMVRQLIERGFITVSIP
jgi:methylase of polypeptide subunit release factors